jgi:hypothetical protein
MSLLKLKMLAVLLGLMCLSACTYEHGLQVAQRWSTRLEFDDQYTLMRQNPVRLHGDAKVCIATGSNYFPESQQRHLSAMLEQALTPNVTAVQRLGQPMTQRRSLAAAYDLECEFLIYPQVVRNEDKVSSVIEIDEADEETINIGFDRQWLQLTTWDVNSERLADLTLIKSRNGFFTVFEHRPEDLMPTTLAAYAREVFALR